LDPLRDDAERSEDQAENEYIKYRKEVVRETQSRYVRILKKLEGKIGDMQAVLNNRGIKPRPIGHRRGHLSSKRKKKDADEEVEKNHHVTKKGEEENSFPYAYLVKYGLSVMMGMVVMALYQRLSSLDKIIKVVKGV
jgi:hypothetical protein